MKTVKGLLYGCDTKSPSARAVPRGRHHPPETNPGDTAMAVHPADERYQDPDRPARVAAARARADSDRGRRRGSIAANSAPAR